MRSLEIFVAADCAASAAAWRIANDVARAAPDLAVRMVDIETEPNSVPASVVAVPTYVLDGRLVHLGKPSPAWCGDLLLRLKKETSHGNRVPAGHASLAGAGGSPERR